VADCLKLVVGLGNPGAKYAATRHNAGYWFVERLAEKYGGSFRDMQKFLGATARVATPHDCWLLKPTTFMNLSGQSVGAFTRYYNIDASELLVVYDELDLPTGAVRLKHGGGDAGHNGLHDIIASLGTRAFWRLRVGIGHPGVGRDVSSYVLKPPGKTQAAEIGEAFDRVEDLLPRIMDGEFNEAMNVLNRRNKDEGND
jgi:PTH1 family peptidyl-tRNA hydrolase